MKIIKKYWWILVILILAVGGYFYYRNTQVRQRQAAIANVQTVRLTKGTITSTVGATGTVRSNQNATVAWAVDGQVGNVAVKIGDQVTKDQILASLSPSSLPQAVLQAQSDLITAQQALEDLQDSRVNIAQAQQNLATAQTNLTKVQQTRAQLNYIRGTTDTIAAANANYLMAQNNVDKLQGIYDNVSSRPENDPVRLNALANLENAKKARDKALVNVNYVKGKPSAQDIATADAALALAQAQVDDAQRAYDRLKNGPSAADIAAAQSKVTAEQGLIDSVNVTAPFDGTVTDLSVQVGDLVTKGTQAVRVDDLSSIFIDLQVSEVDINSVQVGQDVELTFDAIPEKTYNGKVVQVGQVGTTSSGTVNFTVTVQVTNADQDVKSGMTSQATITTSTVANALLVPTRAVRLVGSQHEVYVKRGTQIIPVSVQIGLTSDTMSQIVSGNVKEGDQVVANSATAVAAANNRPGGFGGFFGIFGGGGARQTGGGGNFNGQRQGGGNAGNSGGGGRSAGGNGGGD
ncbi:MAG TPA: efflux RND transporter periplasmic adaptor subunit [Anaerolineaceae bacterium]|nr:efflux RND transporter periplasmic adaptor subunit [Anaerolineaceae bacterium]